MLAQPEISQLDVPVFVQQYVIRFQITVYVIVLVDCFQGQDRFRDVEP